MSLPDTWLSRLRLPVICAPMYHVTTPELVMAARRAGVVGALPRGNAPDFETFDRWLEQIAHDGGGDSTQTGTPLAVNLSTRMTADEMEQHLKACHRHGVELIISATGDPTALIQRSLDHGMRVFSDAVNLRFADKAIAAGAHGIIAIGSGGGGHSGTINHLTLVAAIRKRFEGTVVMAGAVDSGAAVRAAEILGADLAYIGTRFIATHESGASAEYKQMLVEAKASDLVYTPNLNGVHANWLRPSMRKVGLDPDHLPLREEGARGYGHLPAGVVPWSNLWSAGQGVEHIDDIKSVGELVDQLERDYRAACALPSFQQRNS
jgi:nitronate monooxygenase